MLTMRPISSAPSCARSLLDMRRYNVLLARELDGEYGNPDDPREWSSSALLAYHT